MSLAYLYGRHSTDKQELTEDIQKERCFEFYSRHLKPEGVRLAGDGWFYDDAESSAVLFGERPKGRIVLASLQPGDHLVVAKMSRTFRSVRDGENTLHQLKLRNVQVHPLDLQVDTTKAHGRFVRQVWMAADELWREVSREAARETLAYRRAKGLPTSKSIPIGWKAVGEKPRRTYQLDQRERVLAEHIAALYAGGMSLDNIALWGYSQTQFPNKRQFTHRDAVKWVLNARSLGYPKVEGYKAVRKIVRTQGQASGQV